MAEYTQTYTVVLKPVQDGWTAYCLEIPECIGKGPGKRVAYKAVKETIRHYLRQRLVAGQPLPRRNTIIKHPRFNLRELGLEVEEPR